MSSSGFSPKSPNRYLAPNVYLSSVVARNRRPTGADYRQPETGKLYPIASYWMVSIDPTTGVQGELWYLSKIVANVAYWIMLSGGSSGPAVSITVPSGVSPIVPDSLGVFNFTSSLGTLTITGSSASPNNHTINFDLSGGSVGIDSIAVQAITAPGVTPVLPTVAGLMTVNGAVVANHSVVLETRSRALNAYNVEVQYATSAAATDGTKSGVAHFNSSQFSVDASGFVALAGAGQAIDSVGVDATSGGGTNPVLPTVAGLITVNGTLVAAGTNPIRTVSTAANVYQIQAQTSQALAATDATKVGLSNFDSAAFDVDANGFVQLNGGGIAATSFDVQANTAPGTDPVLPTAAGVVTINGAAVANHSVVLETRSRAANAYNLEIQYATSAAATDATKSGVAHFDSGDFTVDANGFVSASGTGIAQTITGDSGGALSPTAGNWNVLGRSGSKTSGTGSTLTISSPPYADAGGSGSVTLNSGSMATAAITLTTPVTAGLLDGDLISFVATNGVLIIQMAATQVGHIGISATSVAGTFTSTATGNSVTFRYQASTNDWWATSVQGNWLGA